MKILLFLHSTFVYMPPWQCLLWSLSKIITEKFLDIPWLCTAKKQNVWIWSLCWKYRCKHNNWLLNQTSAVGSRKLLTWIPNLVFTTHCFDDGNKMLLPYPGKFSSIDVFAFKIVKAHFSANVKEKKKVVCKCNVTFAEN